MAALFVEKTFTGFSFFCAHCAEILRCWNWYENPITDFHRARSADALFFEWQDAKGDVYRKFAGNVIEQEHPVTPGKL